MELEGFVRVGEILKSGIYALVRKGSVVYIGKSKTMLGRIYSHRTLWGATQKGRKTPSWLPKGMLFDDVWVRPCPVSQLDELEREMINIYNPKNNVNLKKGTIIGVDIASVVAGILAGRVPSTPAPKPEGTIRRRV